MLVDDKKVWKDKSFTLATSGTATATSATLHETTTETSRAYAKCDPTIDSQEVVFGLPHVEQHVFHWQQKKCAIMGARIHDHEGLSQHHYDLISWWLC